MSRCSWAMTLMKYIPIESGHSHAMIHVVLMLRMHLPNPMKNTPIMSTPTFVAIALVLSLCSGCGGSFEDLFGKGGETPDNPVVKVDVRGTQLEYRLHAPSDLPEEPVPLLVAFHGGGGRDDAFPQQSKFESLANQEKFIIVYPLAKLQSGNEGEWELNTDAQARDIEFVRAVIDDVSSTYAIDPKRIYATGYSLGSMFIYEVVCQLSDRVVAVASFAGSMPIEPRSCSPQRNVSIMHIHGRKDSIISYAGTWDWKDWPQVGTMHDIPGLVSTWRERYNCEEEDELSSGSTAHIVHTMCDQNVRVEHFRLEDGGHSWPERINGTSTHEVIWRFVSEFRGD